MKRVRQFLLAALAVAALEVALQPQPFAQITLKPRVDPDVETTRSGGHRCDLQAALLSIGLQH